MIVLHAGPWPTLDAIPVGIPTIVLDVPPLFAAFVDAFKAGDEVHLIEVITSPIHFGAVGDWGVWLRQGRDPGERVILVTADTREEFDPVVRALFGRKVWVVAGAPAGHDMLTTPDTRHNLRTR